MRPGNNPVEKVKAEKDGLDILEEIEELAVNHGGWETLDAGDRDRLKWIGTFFRKPTPGQFMMRIHVSPTARRPPANCAPLRRSPGGWATAPWT